MDFMGEANQTMQRVPRGFDPNQTGNYEEVSEQTDAQRFLSHRKVSRGPVLVLTMLWLI